MASYYWDPFTGLDAVRREMERILGQFEPGGGSIGRQGGPAGAGRLPLMNVAEDAESVRVEMLAPGLDPESIEVSVLRDQLRISGVKSAVNPDIKPEAYHRSERGAGRFTRALTLPVEVDGDKVTAEYVNGIVRLTLPKHEAAKPKKIAVSVK